MTHHLSHWDRMADLTATAVAEAWHVHDQLFNVVIPSLPSPRRLFSEQIMRRIGADRFLDEAFLRDLQSLIQAIHREVADRTQIFWVADEHDVRGGHDVRHRDARTTALASAVKDLADLHRSISDVLCAARAARFVDEQTLE